MLARNPGISRFLGGSRCLPGWDHDELDRLIEASSFRYHPSLGRPAALGSRPFRLGNAFPARPARGWILCHSPSNPCPSLAPGRIHTEVARAARAQCADFRVGPVQMIAAIAGADLDGVLAAVTAPVGRLGHSAGREPRIARWTSCSMAGCPYQTLACRIRAEFGVLSGQRCLPGFVTSCRTPWRSPSPALRGAAPSAAPRAVRAGRRSALVATAFRAGRA